MTKEKPSESQVRDALLYTAEKIKSNTKLGDAKAYELARKSYREQEKIKGEK